jgi:hypothetical protein
MTLVMTQSKGTFLAARRTSNLATHIVISELILLIL